MSFVEFTHPEDADLDWGLYQDLLAGKRGAYTIEKRYRTKQGEIVWGRITVSLVAAAPHRPLYSVALVEDITEQKRAQQEEQAALAALRQSEERLRIATQAGHIGIFDWDLQTGNVTWSGELEGLFGLPPSSSPGTFAAFVALLHPEDSAWVVAKVMEAIASGQPYAEEYRVVRPDGTACWIAAEAAVFYGPDGRPIRMTGTSVDTTARHSMEQQREKALYDLAERVKELSALQPYREAAPGRRADHA